MEEAKFTFLQKIEPKLKRVETILWITLILGMSAYYLGLNTIIAVQFSLAILILIFLLFAFIPIDVGHIDGDPFGIKELLAWSIIPKLLWLSCAVACFGLLLYSANFNNAGYLQALAIGSLGLTIATIILSLLFLTGTKKLDNVLPILVRTIPVLIVSIQIFTDAL
jgi:hypothetical protein